MLPLGRADLWGVLRQEDAWRSEVVISGFDAQSTATKAPGTACICLCEV